jgi:hypothetical protein
MTAKGKINASNVTTGDRIIVKAWFDAEGHERITESATKTGDGVFVARVIAKTFRAAQGPYEARGRYVIETTAGSFEAAPIQTMWLAPEDNAGLKRAHAEALAEKIEHERAEIDTAWAEELKREEAVDAQTAQVENWLARHREQGTPSREWSSIENGRQADHEEALTLNSQAGKVDNMNNDASTEAPALITQTDDTEVMDAALAKLDNATGSTVVRLLEKVWARIREDHVDLPEVIIITGSGLVGASKWGHFRADGWKVREEGSALRKDELFLAGEALAKGAAQVLQTMLHEAAHTLAKVRGQQDTSRQGRWHNAKFKELAAEMGLEHKAAQADSSHGFSFVTLTETTKARYADLLAELDTEIRLTCHLPAWLGGEDEKDGGEKITGKPTKGGGSTSNNVKAVCRCEKPRIIRVSRTVLEEAGIMCRDCDSDFEAA